MANLSAFQGFVNTEAGFRVVFKHDDNLKAYADIELKMEPLYHDISFDNADALCTIIDPCQRFASYEVSSETRSSQRAIITCKSTSLTLSDDARIAALTRDLECPVPEYKDANYYSYTAASADDDGDGLYNFSDCAPRDATRGPINFYKDSDDDGFADVEVKNKVIYYLSYYNKNGCFKFSERPVHATMSTSIDNCSFVYNPTQKDSDFDSVGDACDPDVGTVSSATTLQRTLQQLNETMRLYQVHQRRFNKSMLRNVREIINQTLKLDVKVLIEDKYKKDWRSIQKLLVQLKQKNFQGAELVSALSEKIDVLVYRRDTRS